MGLGNLFPDEPADDARAAEIAVIVEDAHQRRGIGTRLMRHLQELSERLGFREVVATVLADNAPILHLLDSSALDWASRLE